jgi:hypothetical protein
MTEQNRRVSRRVFAKGLAMAPLGAAMASSALGHAAAGAQSGNAPNSPAHPRKTDALATRRFVVAEPEPFAAPLVFARRPFWPRLEPFPLSDVQLDRGPLADARDWNRGFLLRIANERQLRNFRMNAGLSATAQPLGGWEAPSCELRGHYVGHVM